MRMYRHINGALGHVSSSCVLPTEALVRLPRRFTSRNPPTWRATHSERARAMCRDVGAERRRESDRSGGDAGAVQVHHEAMDVERRTHDGDVALPWREHCISCHVYLGTVREEPPPLPTSTRAKTKGLLSWLHRKKAALRQRQHSTRLMRDYVKVL